MTTWWLGRTSREQAAMGALAVAAALFILFEFGLKPLVNYRRDAQADYDGALALITQIETDAHQIQALQAVRTPRSAVPARTAASMVAGEQGLSLTRLQPLENGDLDIWLDDVASPVLFKWLGSLSEHHGIAVVRAAIQRNDNGTVRAQITLAGGP